jgi:transcription-repair coupling factor (superfamily II helicase)
MTATPIPRTLYMSLTGARDLSTIQTPPQDRIAVATRVVDNTDEIIREAILHEMNREGQVFYIYNRVMTIARVAERIQALVPQARIGVAHGQMAAGELARIMRQFSSGDLDVLVSTTIVESGLDIPNANTILIDRADRFGLAELYQLRGRVGRASQKGFAYMLLPGRAGIDPIARKRIQAITQYTDLGAGFRLAMRDLEIRGAGNLLGTEQSGHITTVGFGLYCQLLKRTVALRKGEDIPPIIDVDLRLDFMDYSPSTFDAANSAVIPSRYIEDERLRVSMYRKIAEASLPADIRRLNEEFRDRFGPSPKSLTRLLQIALIRIFATGCGITIIETKDEKLMCTRDSNYLMPGGLFPRLRKRNPDGKLAEILAFLKKQAARNKRLE